VLVEIDLDQVDVTCTLLDLARGTSPPKKGRRTSRILVKVNASPQKPERERRWLGVVRIFIQT